jgi:hypothetical protein
VTFALKLALLIVVVKNYASKGNEIETEQKSDLVW